MLLSKYRPPHAKNLPMDLLRLRVLLLLLRLGVLPMVSAAFGQVAHRQKPLFALLHLTHIRDHHASASAFSIAPMKIHSHVWHSHHTLLPRCP
jgi:hypothetical protein